MRYVRLGKTDLEVAAIAFGTWAFGGEWAARVHGPTPEGI
jgi:aryl-alcohol dehydrogenase-like predicted oxidoreductase